MPFLKREENTPKCLRYSLKTTKRRKLLPLEYTSKKKAHPKIYYRLRGAFFFQNTILADAYNGIDEALCPVLKPIKGENTND
jgi:hypothetical protein